MSTSRRKDKQKQQEKPKKEMPSSASPEASSPPAIAIEDEKKANLRRAVLKNSADGTYPVSKNKNQ